MLRSCYASAMRFGPSLDSPIIWYFVPRTNPVMPFPHSFGSINYSQFKSQNGPLGELFNVPKPWYNGATPVLFLDPRCPGSPTGYVGSELQWRSGCGPTPISWVGLGGVGFGGKSDVDYLPLLSSLGGLSCDGRGVVMYNPGFLTSEGGGSFDGSASVTYP